MSVLSLLLLNQSMYSPSDYMERPSLSNRGYYSDLTDHHRSLYGRDYGSLDEENPDQQDLNEATYTHSQGVRQRSFGRVDIINRVEYRRSQQRPTSFGRIDRTEREDLEISGDVRSRIRRTKSDILDRQEDEREPSDQPDSAMHRSSMENLAAIPSPGNVRSFKDQETMIQEIKKENFDLKLRLYMEQKERERLNEEFQQKVVVLETDLTDSLDELSDALEREKDYEISLNNSRRREKALMTKLRRLEETTREQDEEIKYLVESRSTYDLSLAQPCDVATQTERPGYYEERGIDIGVSKGMEVRHSSRNLQGTGVRSSSRSRTSGDETDVGKQPEKQPPEGVDLLNSASIARKEQILGEARRRRTLKSKKDKQRKKEKALDEMPEVDQTQKTKKKKKKGFFKNFLCCGSSKTETDIYERSDIRRV